VFEWDTGVREFKSTLFVLDLLLISLDERLLSDRNCICQLRRFTYTYEWFYALAMVRFIYIDRLLGINTVDRLMIIAGAITLITAVCYFLFFPNNPSTAWFLTPEERVIAILRIKSNQSGTENKHFKVEQ
jgi:hypothetical protein